MTADGERVARPALAAAFAATTIGTAAVIGIDRGMTSGSHWWELVLLTLGAVGGGIFEVRIAPRIYFSGIFVFSIIVAAFLGPLAAFLTPTIACAVAGLVHRAGRQVIVGNCAGVALPNVIGSLLMGAWLPSDLGSWLTPVVVGTVALVPLALNFLVSGIYYALLGVWSPADLTQALRSHAPGLVLSCVFAGSVGAVYAASPAVGIAFSLVLMLAVLYVTRQVAGSIEDAHRIGELAESRRALAVDAMQAEERERRRIAERLHDDALQSLLSARQDIRSVARGDVSRLEAAETAVEAAVAELRDTVAQLHPAPTAAAGFGPMLRAVADAEARRGRFRVEVSAAPAVESGHDRLLLGVSRELLINVARHADAQLVRVTASADDGFVVLEVGDDGRGMGLDDRRLALANGHVGLASITERVEALGGSVSIASPTEHGRGTSVTVRVPR